MMRQIGLLLWVLCLAGVSVGLQAGSTPVALAVGSVEGPPGSTRAVPFTLTSGDTNVDGLQFEMVIPAGLSVNPASLTLPNGASGVCSRPANLICLVFSPSGTGLPAQVVFTLSFAADAGAALGVRPLVPINVLFADPKGNALAGNSTAGQFTVVSQGPGVLGSTPAPGALIDWGNVVFLTTGVRTLELRNTAEEGAMNLQVSTCSISPVNGFQMDPPPPDPLVLAAGAEFSLSLRFVAPAGPAAQVQATLACTVATGAGMPQVLSWPLRAQVVADPLLADGFEAPDLR